MKAILENDHLTIIDTKDFRLLLNANRPVGATDIEPRLMRFSGEEDYGYISGSIPCAEIGIRKTHAVKYELFAWRFGTGIVIEAVTPGVLKTKSYDSIFFSSEESARSGDGYGQGEVSDQVTELIKELAVRLFSKA